MEALAIGLATQRTLARSVDAIAYNLANSNTTGFKATAEQFFSKTGTADGVLVDYVVSDATALQR